MKWQKFSIEADVDFVRVPVDANGNLQPWTAIYHVDVLDGHHSFIPTALPIMAPLPPPPPMPLPGQCDQIEQDLKEGNEYTVTVHYGEGQIGGDPAQSDSNVSGVPVRTLRLGQKAPGEYRSKARAAYWDGRDDAGEPVTSGIYFYQLSAGDFSATRRMVIMK